MMHRYMFYRMVNGHFLLGLVALLLVVGIVLLVVYLTSRKYKTPAMKSAGVDAIANPAAIAVNATQERLLAILAEQKAGGGMGAAEYEERRMVLDGGRGDNHASAELVSLKERYARGELTTGAYVEARNKLIGIV
ncbi:hypothetical protein SDC9_141978 [bioreactor metagenome]|uniref:SHOCT domain-containing protein n=1 Tax=bioreactor metagenome TaxID=1076179 RepID=A0A645DZ81_9ZZZZ|nr:hypothetical protein [Christensenella sp.]